MADEQAELRDYYEQEAALRRRGPLRGRRIDWRNDFISLLAAEGRRSVLDGGAGPGLDGRAFHDAGYRFVGVDLARGNGRLAAEAGVDVVQGSVTALPIRPGSFDSGWSFSTLMHLSDGQAATAVGQFITALRPRAPLMVGLWGAETEQVVIDDTELPGRRRAFRHRSFDHNRALLEAKAEVEWSEHLESPSGGSDYHVFRLRTGDVSSAEDQDDRGRSS